MLFRDDCVISVLRKCSKTRARTRQNAVFSTMFVYVHGEWLFRRVTKEVDTPLSTCSHAQYHDHRALSPYPFDPISDVCRVLSYSDPEYVGPTMWLSHMLYIVKDMTIGMHSCFQIQTCIQRKPPVMMGLNGQCSVLHDLGAFLQVHVALAFSFLEITRFGRHVGQ